MCYKQRWRNATVWGEKSREQERVGRTLLSTYQWFINSAGFSFLFGGVTPSLPPSLALHPSPSLALPPSRAHTHIQLLSLDQSICHPQGQRSSILGRKHYRACSAYPPPPHPPPEIFPPRAEEENSVLLQLCLASAINKEWNKFEPISNA